MTHGTLFAALSLAAPALLAAQTVDGRLVDDKTSAAIAGASISLVPGGRGDTTTVVTDSTGRFRVAATIPGTYALRIRRIGIQPALTNVFWLGPLTERRPLLRMDVVGLASDTVRVTAKGLTVTDWTQGFFERRRATHGTFLTSADLANRNPLQASDWFLGVRGLTVDHAGGRVRFLANRSAGGCAMDVYVDDLPLPDGDLNSLLRGDDIAAVEVYPSRIDAPTRYRQRGCGLVLVWTRNDADPSEIADGAAAKP